jgi:acetyl-CoA carboxylase biotin carboxyl carrier protein
MRMPPEPAKKEPMQLMPKDMKGKPGVDRDLIRELAKLLEETGLSEIEIDREGMRVRVARQLTINAAPAATAGPAPAAPAAASAGGAPAGERSAAADDPGKHPGCVRSPMVGTAYLAPEPGAPAFVESGSRVAQGQTILIIEAMKTMNHIPAPRAGTVTRILVGNRQPVEFGEPLAIIE